MWLIYVAVTSHLGPCLLKYLLYLLSSLEAQLEGTGTCLGWRLNYREALVL